jgi:hypothetical protein
MSPDSNPALRLLQAVRDRLSDGRHVAPVHSDLRVVHDVLRYRPARGRRRSCKCGEPPGLPLPRISGICTGPWTDAVFRTYHCPSAQRHDQRDLVIGFAASTAREIRGVAVLARALGA